MPKPAFQFVDNIRCIAMLAIVTEHTSLGSYIFTKDDTPYWAYLTSVQVFKFGTIAFFLIAGFLFAENKDTYRMGEYLKRRFNNIFKPWIIWSLVFLAFLTTGPFIESVKSGVPPRLIISGLWWGVKTVYLHSNYWFIMNYFFCTSVLLLSKRVLHSWAFGGILFAFTAFYSVNVYAEWIIPQHTTALFGFIFFYWLGVQLRRYYEVIEEKIKKISSELLVAATLATLFVAILELDYLYTLGKIDPNNTLKPSNIVFSLTIFLTLLKIRNFSWLAFLQPRQTTYGIFLIHYILVFNLIPVVLGEVDIATIRNFTVWQMYQYEFSRFFIVYTLSFIIVQLLGRSRYGWLVGSYFHKKPVFQNKTKVVPRQLSLETEAA